MVDSTLTEQQMEDIVAKAIERALPVSCKYQQYMQDTELTPAKHMEDHHRFHSLFGTAGKVGNKILMSCIGVITAVFICAFGWGIIETISKKLEGN